MANLSLPSRIHADSGNTYSTAEVGALTRKRRPKLAKEVLSKTCQPTIHVIETDTGESLQREAKRLRKNSHSNDSESGLCDDCEDIDFEHIARVARVNIPTEGVKVAHLGHRLSRKAATRCPTCRLFETVRNIYRGKYSQQLRAYNRDIARFEYERTPYTSHEKKRVPFLAVVRANNGLSYDEKFFENEIGKRGVLVPVTHQIPPVVEIHSVDPYRIDFDLLASWISTCKCLHMRCHGSITYRKNIMKLRAIDCFTEQIVSIELTQEYIALSYVWGAAAPGLASSGSSRKDGAKPFQVSTAPLTIRDAITVVKRLGRRYFWVDKYCVSQHKSTERHEALQNMDLIYENSIATIVALHGANDEAGLPGVSSTPRQAQPRYDYGSGCLISTLPPLRWVIAESVWATRGWTYQEARLSKRCLFFTDYQVYFVCGQGTVSETIRGGPTTSSMAALLNNTYLNEALFAKDQPEQLTGLLGDRLTYSQRQLTYDSDALNAFRGFLARSTLVSFWGVSIMPLDSALDPDLGLALGLMWRKRSRMSLLGSKFRKYEQNFCTRRVGDSSTVWAYLHGDKAFGALNAFSPKFSLVSTTGEMRSLRSILANTMSSIIPEISSSLYVDGEVVRVRLFQASFSSRLRENARFKFCDDDLNDIPGKIARMTRDLQDPDTSDQLPGGYDDYGCKNPVFTERHGEALILLDGDEWVSENVKYQRLVMMLLKWTGPNRAARAGLLSSLADDRWDIDFVKRIPRTRRQFELT